MAEFRKVVLPVYLAIFFLFAFIQSGFAEELRAETIYQIFTDRFCNGDPKNDDPEVSKGMFDPQKKNWNAYWGGDLQGVIDKLPYLKKMGFTAIWISPVIDNVNKPTIEADGRVMAPYHGYHARNFKGIDEHIGDWKVFDRLIESAHKRGIKVMVDMPLNHTSTINHGEFGALYDGMEFMSDTENDRNKLFHHLPEIADWNDPYQLQYYTLAWLGDLNQENSYIDTYLGNAVLNLKKHGADATRLDAAKHANWGWQSTVVNKLYDQGRHFVVAEWWMSDTDDPLYHEAVKFVNKAGIGMFDFPFATTIRKVLGEEKDGFRHLAKVIEREDADLKDPNALITFIDNHDMPRFTSLNADRRAVDLALALMYTVRGIPSVYYGTEQYIHDDTKGGGDPYTRVWMKEFDEGSEGFKLITELNRLRRSSQALLHGSQQSIEVSDDVYIFKREFGGHSAVVAVNKAKKESAVVSAERLAAVLDASDNAIDDALAGRLSGIAFPAKAKTFSLPARSVSVWLAGKGEANSDIQPEIASVSPGVIHGGKPVNINGIGFGEKRGKVLADGESLSIRHWSNTNVEVTSPASVHGEVRLLVERADGVASKSKSFTALSGKLVPITFQVEKPSFNWKGERLYITGSASNLGSWSRKAQQAAGPLLLSEDRDYILCVALPAGKKVSFKLMILDKEGKLIKEEKKIHTYKVPDQGPWRHKLRWQDDDR